MGSELLEFAAGRTGPWRPRRVRKLGRWFTPARD